MSANLKTKPSRPQVQSLALDAIIDDAELQPRQQMDLDTLREYSLAWIEGANFPPVVVFYDGEFYWLADGFFRVRSARKAMMKDIKAEVYDGSKRDAILYSKGANALHGVRRTPADKKRAVVTMLDDPEWCLWSDISISKACRVSAGFVAGIRQGSSELRGHTVAARLRSDGTVSDQTTKREAPKDVPAATFQMPPTAMTRGEIREKFLRRIARHIARSEAVERDVPALPGRGTVSIVTPTRLFTFGLYRSASNLYEEAGRMLVANCALTSTGHKKARAVVIVGHFGKNVGDLIAAMKGLGIECKTPEQVLAD